MTYRAREHIADDTGTAVNVQPSPPGPGRCCGAAARLCYSGHLLMENRNALIVDAELTGATGYAERDSAAEMLGRLPKTKRRRTVGADKGYDTAGFVAEVRDLGFTPQWERHGKVQLPTEGHMEMAGAATRRPKVPTRPSAAADGAAAGLR